MKIVVFCKSCNHFLFDADHYFVHNLQYCFKIESLKNFLNDSNLWIENFPVFLKKSTKTSLNEQSSDELYLWLQIYNWKIILKILKVFSKNSFVAFVLIPLVFVLNQLQQEKKIWGTISFSIIVLLNLISKQNWTN